MQADNSTPVVRPSGVAATEPEDWVPLERRWLGLDRATLPYGFGVLALVVFMALVLPWLDATIPNPDSVRSGDILKLSSGVSFQPPTGWTIESGARASEPPPKGWPASATVSSGGTRVSVKAAPYTGSPDALLTAVKNRSDALNGQVGFHVVGAATPFTTGQGVTGLLSRYESPSAVGILAVAVLNGVGVDVQATGAQTLGRDTVLDVAGILDTLTFEQAGR